jgi:ribonuclease HII
LKELGVDDSKALTEEQRDKLLDKVLTNDDYLGWAVHILSPR